MKKHLLFIFAAWLPMLASAKVEIDGIWYNLYSDESKAEVTFKGDNPWEYEVHSDSINIPSKVTYEGVDYSVTSIGRWAFAGCSRLAAITIPEGVTSIGEMSFRDCSNLQVIAIPEGVTSIGSSAFSGCSSLTAITVAEGNTMYDSRGGCNAIIETSNNTLIAGCSATIIPEGVTSIGSHAFQDHSYLTAITIPEGVTSIGSYAFQGCSSLAAITIPEGVTSIGDWVFQACSSLTSIILPESVTSIGRGIFYDCSSLTTITIPEGVTSIGGEAFARCSSLTTITIPEGVTRIGGSTFEGCSSLTDITIPDGVISIGYMAFYNCLSLKRIVLPKSLKDISDGAFGYCAELLDMYCYAETVPQTESKAFGGCHLQNATLHVPASAVESYKSSAPWSTFGTIVALTNEEMGIEQLTSEKSQLTIYDLCGHRVEKTEKGGIYIVNGRKVVIK